MFARACVYVFMCEGVLVYMCASTCVFTYKYLCSRVCLNVSVRMCLYTGERVELCISCLRVRMCVVHVARSVRA